MCEICGRIGYHHPGCPYYVPPRPIFRCSICNEGIFEGEEYINVGGDTAHVECFSDARHLLGWLGIHIDMVDSNDY